MSKLTRFTQQVFGSNASTNQMAQFGSFAAGAPLTYNGAAITPAIVQALPNYLTGWFSSVIGNNSPLIEDMNSLCYLFAYQLAYLMQQGIAEWDSATTYYTGSMVNSGGVIYISLQDNNINKSLSNTAYWSTSGYGNYFVGSDAALSTAITSTTSAGGGVIVLSAPFNLTSAHTIPSGTKLLGQLGSTLLTVSGSGSLTFSDTSKMQDVYFTTALTSGNMVTLSGSYATVSGCKFTIPSSSTGSCIYVTGNANKMRDNIFVGVAGETAIGIDYVSGVDNADYDSVFLP